MTTLSNFSTSPLQAAGRLIIDLQAIIDNWQYLSGKSVHGQCAAVVKADAYGLGVKPVVGALGKAGCREFFVATLQEAVEVRALDNDATIYTFDGYHNGGHEIYRDQRITPILISPEQVMAWVEAKQAGMAAGLHVDTGINRLGLSREDVGWLTGSAKIMTALNPEIVISHFACADDPDAAMNDQQISRFSSLGELFPNARKSMANSAGIFLGDKAHFDLLRPGISLYGGEAVNDVENPMKPVVTLKGRILQIRTAKSGETVGYGATAKLQRDTKIGIIGIGYADGLHRSASGSGTALRNHNIGEGGYVMIGEHKAPYLGRVSMDMTCIDVTDIPQTCLELDDDGQFWADLINTKLRIDTLSGSAGTIGYEILTSLGKRYQRQYLL